MTRKQIVTTLIASVVYQIIFLTGHFIIQNSVYWRSQSQVSLIFTAIVFMGLVIIIKPKKISAICILLSEIVFYLLMICFPDQDGYFLIFHVVKGSGYMLNFSIYMDALIVVVFKTVYQGAIFVICAGFLAIYGSIFNIINSAEQTCSTKHDRVEITKKEILKTALLYITYQIIFWMGHMVIHLIQNGKIQMLLSYVFTFALLMVVTYIKKNAVLSMLCVILSQFIFYLLMLCHPNLRGYLFMCYISPDSYWFSLTPTAHEKILHITILKFISEIILIAICTGIFAIINRIKKNQPDNTK